MKFDIRDKIVYCQETTINGAFSELVIGNEIQYETTESDTQKIYQWQKFNLNICAYEDDITNTTTIEGQVPIKGKVVIEKIPQVIKEPVDEEKIVMAESIIELTNQIDNLQSQINKLSEGK